MFLLAGVNQLYEQAPTSDPIRRDLNAIKTRAWELLDMLHKLPGALVEDAKFDFLTGQESKNAYCADRRPCAKDTTASSGRS